MNSAAPIIILIIVLISFALLAAVIYLIYAFISKEETIKKMTEAHE